MTSGFLIQIINNMDKYKIRLDYSTGNSFGSEDTSDYLELTFNNLDIAKENLKRITEHYQMYLDIQSWGSTKTRTQWYDEMKSKDWFVNKPKLWCISSNRAIDEKDKKKCGDGNWEYRPDDHYATHCLKLFTDDGVPIQISAFWCGYFEKLNVAEIELDNSDMKVYF